MCGEPTLSAIYFDQGRPPRAGCSRPTLGISPPLLSRMPACDHFRSGSSLGTTPTLHPRRPDPSIRPSPHAGSECVAAARFLHRCVCAYSRREMRRANNSRALDHLSETYDQATSLSCMQQVKDDFKDATWRFYKMIFFQSAVGNFSLGPSNSGGAPNSNGTFTLLPSARGRANGRTTGAAYSDACAGERRKPRRNLSWRSNNARFGTFPMSDRGATQLALGAPAGADTMEP